MKLYIGDTTRTTVNLKWTHASVGAIYRLFRDGQIIYEGDRISYTDHGLSPGVHYTYTITDVDETESDTAATDTSTELNLCAYRTAEGVAADYWYSYYNVSDLLRVGEAVTYVADLLKSVGCHVEVEVKLDWQMYDIPTMDQMRQYIANIQSIRSSMEMFRSTPAAPETMDGLTWQKANDIEQILLDAERIVLYVMAGLARTGQFDAWCSGSSRMIPTAKSDPGRTWGELDAMETTWSNWQEATWFLLLYGNLEAEGDVF